jgi:hypothetical protein
MKGSADKCLPFFLENEVRRTYNEKSPKTAINVATPDAVRPGGRTLS